MTGVSMSGKSIFATVGDNCIDRIAPPVARHLIGGNALNYAVQLAMIGKDAAYFGAVGKDPDGDAVIAALKMQDVDTSHIERLNAPTAYTDIVFDDSGDRVLDFEEFGASGIYRPSAAVYDALARMRHVHIGFLQDNGATKKALLQRGVSVSQDLTVNSDPCHRDPSGLSIGFASAGTDAEKAEHLLAELLGSGVKVAVITCGTNGSIASDGKQTARTGIAPSQVIDPTGAGDTMAAIFTAAYLDGLDLQSALEQGRDAAARTCAHAGGFPQ